MSSFALTVNDVTVVVCDILRKIPMGLQRNYINDVNESLALLSFSPFTMDKPVFMEVGATLKSGFWVDKFLYAVYGTVFDHLSDVSDLVQATRLVSVNDDVVHIDSLMCNVVYKIISISLCDSVSHFLQNYNATSSHKEETKPASTAVDSKTASTDAVPFKTTTPVVEHGRRKGSYATAADPAAGTGLISQPRVTLSGLKEKAAAKAPDQTVVTSWADEMDGIPPEVRALFDSEKAKAAPRPPPQPPAERKPKASGERAPTVSPEDTKLRGEFTQALSLRVITKLIELAIHFGVNVEGYDVREDYSKLFNVVRRLILRITFPQTEFLVTDISSKVCEGKSVDELSFNLLSQSYFMTSFYYHIRNSVESVGATGLQAQYLTHICDGVTEDKRRPDSHNSRVPYRFSKPQKKPREQ